MADVINFNDARKLVKRPVGAILAISTDGVIGLDNQIPWKCSLDMKFFKRTTTGNVVIMGRKTFESIGSKPLSNRVNIVLSGTLNPDDYVGGDIHIVRSFHEAITLAREVNLTHLDDVRNTVNEHIFVMGGGEVYKQSEDYLNGCIISLIDKTIITDENKDRVVGPNVAEMTYRVNGMGTISVVYLDQCGIVNTKDDTLISIVKSVKGLHINDFIKFKE